MGLFAPIALHIGVGNVARDDGIDVEPALDGVTEIGCSGDTVAVLLLVTIIQLIEDMIVEVAIITHHLVVGIGAVGIESGNGTTGLVGVVDG